MKKTRCSLNWQCPNCGRIYTFEHWSEGEELKIIFSCPKENIAPETSMTFTCNKCGWEFKIWVEKEEMELLPLLSPCP